MSVLSFSRLPTPQPQVPCASVRGQNTARPSPSSSSNWSKLTRTGKDCPLPYRAVAQVSGTGSVQTPMSLWLLPTLFLYHRSASTRTAVLLPPRRSSPHRAQALFLLIRLFPSQSRLFVSCLRPAFFRSPNPQQQSPSFSAVLASPSRPWFLGVPHACALNFACVQFCRATSVLLALPTRSATNVAKNLRHMPHFLACLHSARLQVLFRSAGSGRPPSAYSSVLSRVRPPILVGTVIFSFASPRRTLLPCSPPRFQSAFFLRHLSSKTNGSLSIPILSWELLSVNGLYKSPTLFNPLRHLARLCHRISVYRHIGLLRFASLCQKSQRAFAGALASPRASWQVTPPAPSLRLTCFWLFTPQPRRPPNRDPL
ncbi:hypothetical protein TRVL_06276 [Trypanosoma vivax]|nr:hypothetical protein TRVL_06276 [Trypanosoma vivax]